MNANMKILAIAMVLTAAVIGIAAIDHSEESDAASHTVDYDYSDGGYCVISRQMGDIYAAIANGASIETGNNLCFEAFPSSGYQFDYWTVNGFEESTSTPYYMDMPNRNITIYAQFSLIPVSYTVSFGSNNSSYGSASASRDMGDGTYAYFSSGSSIVEGSSIKLEAFPNVGYVFDHWTANGTTVSYNSTYYTTSPSNNVTYTAYFTAGSAHTFTVSENNSNYGNTTGAYYSNGQWVYFNSSRSCLPGLQMKASAAASTGYEFVNWTSGGSVVSTNPVYEFTMPNSNYSLVANFRQQTFDIDIQSNNSNYGSVNPSAVYNVPYGSTITVSNNTLVINGTTVTATASQPSSSYQYAFSSWDVSDQAAVTSDMTITATFVQSARTYTVSFEPNNSSYGTTVGSRYQDGIWVYFNSPYSILPGETMRIRATPATGYNFVNWTLNGNIVSTNELYEFTTTSSDVYYTANFAVKTFDVTILSNNTDYGTVSPGSVQNVPYGTVIGVNGTTMTVNGTNVIATPTTSTPESTYSFDSWDVSDGDTVTSDMTITATFTLNTPKYMLYFAPNDSDYGYASAAEYVNGTWVWFNSGRDTSVGATLKLHAVPKDGYRFVNWTDSNGIVVSTHLDYHFTMPAHAETYTANYEVKPDTAFWSNDLYNGTVTIAFKFSGTNMTHDMAIPLYSATFDEQRRATWTPTGEVLNVSVSYPATITCSLDDEEPVTARLGNWTGFVLIMSISAGSIQFIPMDTFSDFTSYTLLETQATTVYTWDADGTTAYDIQHSDSGTGTPVRFSVVDTWTYLDTFGVVLNDPHINVTDYFPQYQKVRVNLYGFAVYGDAVTINGKSWDVTGSEITITYTTDDSGINHWAQAGTQGASTKNLTLSNISITWDGTNCWLESNTDGFAIDLGSYSSASKTFSFTGLWYFTATLDEPYTATKTVVSGDWDSLLNIDAKAVILIFLGIVILAGLFCHVKFKLKWLDAAVIVIALITAFMLLG